MRLSQKCMLGGVLSSLGEERMPLHSKAELWGKDGFSSHTCSSHLSLFLLLSSDSVQKTQGKILTELPDLSAPWTMKCSLAKKKKIWGWWEYRKHQAQSGKSRLSFALLQDVQVPQAWSCPEELKLRMPTRKIFWKLPRALCVRPLDGWNKTDPEKE